MNDTILKFGYPATLVRDYAHWVVLLRPSQPTLGSLVLAAKSEAKAFPELEPGAFAELSVVTGEIENTLRGKVGAERFNYMMLMMVDPHVHFHVIPRYEGEREAHGYRIADAGWPKLPDLGSAVALEEEGIASLANWLKDAWRA